MGSMSLIIDSQVPDPFDQAGYLGVFHRSAARASADLVRAEVGLQRQKQGYVLPDVAYYAFPNGWSAGVLLGSREHPACNVGDARRPFELAVLHGSKRRPCYASGLTSDVFCSLNAAGVRRELKAIAALSPKTGCRHKR